MAALTKRTRGHAAMPVVPDAENWIDDDILTVTIAAQNMGTGAGAVGTKAVPNGARHAFFQNRGSNDVFIRPKSGSLGGDPDETSAGMILFANGGVIDWTSDPSALRLKADPAGTGNTSVYVCYFGEQ